MPDDEADDKEQIAQLAQKIFQKEFDAETTRISTWLQSQTPLTGVPAVSSPSQDICPVCKAEGDQPCIEFIDVMKDEYPHLDRQIASRSEPHPERLQPWH